MNRRFYSLHALVVTLALLSACRKLESERERNTETRQPAPAEVSTEIALDDKTAQMLGIQVAAAGRARLPLVVRASGRIVAQVQRTRQVRTPFTGRVESVAVEINQPVRASQTLAVVTSPDLPVLKAEMAKADAALGAAQKTFQRQKRLTEIGAGSQRELQQAQLELDAARIERERALLRIRESGLDPEKILGTNPRINITAPQSGVVVERNVSPGELIASDALLFRLVNTDVVDALLDVYETHLDSIRTGQVVEIRVPAHPDRIFRGRVTTVGTVLDPQSRTVPVRVTLNNSQQSLKPEMLCEAEIVVGQTANAVAVPESAVVDDDGIPVVYVRSGQKYVRRPVHLGAKTLRSVEVLSGVNPGELVVTRGGYQLKAMALKSRPEGEHEE